jgi:dCTP deaminase
MILAGPTIRVRQPLTPWTERYHRNFKLRADETTTLSGGVGIASYDVHLSENTKLTPIHPGQFKLLHTMEQFNMPNDIAARVADKSTLVRLGLCMQNTFIDPGWRGHLTLEVTNHSNKTLTLHPGMPIAQIVFEFVDRVTPGYSGRYQDQPDEPIRTKVWPDNVDDAMLKAQRESWARQDMD